MGNYHDHYGSRPTETAHRPASNELGPGPKDRYHTHVPGYKKQYEGCRYAMPPKRSGYSLRLALPPPTNTVSLPPSTGELKVHHLPGDRLGFGTHK